VPIIDRVIDHLPAIIPRLGDTLKNADAVLDYLGWGVNTPLVNTLEMHGGGSSVVKLGRVFGGGGGRKKGERMSMLADEIEAGMKRTKKLEERIVVEGWIKKRSTSARLNSLVGKCWKRKWVVIDVGGCMSVYKEEGKSGSSLRFRVYLGGCQVVEKEVGRSFKVKVGAGGDRGESVHHFRVKSLESYCMWIMNFRAWEGGCAGEWGEEGGVGEGEGDGEGGASDESEGEGEEWEEW